MAEFSRRRCSATDLARMAGDIAEFASDEMQDPEIKQALFADLQSALKKFENRTGVPIT